MGPILSEALKKLIPNDQSLDTFNSQYIQRHSPSATHLLGAASVSQALGTPITEIEDLLFQCIADKTIDVKVCIFLFVSSKMAIYLFMGLDCTGYY